MFALIHTQPHHTILIRFPHWSSRDVSNITRLKIARRNRSCRTCFTKLVCRRNRLTTLPSHDFKHKYSISRVSSAYSNSRIVTGASQSPSQRHRGDFRLEFCAQPQKYFGGKNGLRWEQHGRFEEVLVHTYCRISVVIWSGRTSNVIRDNTQCVSGRVWRTDH